MELVDTLYAAIREHEALEEYELVEAPCEPADPDALDAVAKELGLPPDYVAFLARADGWSGVIPGWELLGTDALVEAQEHAATTFEDCETEEAVAASALVIGRSENDAGMLFYDRRTLRDDGSMELVDWLYEERARHGGLLDLFAGRLGVARAGIASEHAARSALEAEWTAAWRTEDAKRLLAATRERLAHAEMPARLGVERLALLDAAGGEPLVPEQLDADDAKLCISLFVHLRAAPSPGEIRAIVAAFRRHFREPAFPNVARFSWDEGRRATLADGDPVLDAAIGSPARGGELGITVTLASTDAEPEHRLFGRFVSADPVLAIHVPGPLETKTCASCIDVKVPVGTDPSRIRALALEIAALVPFLYGYASYGALAQGVSGVTKVYEWSRRCLGIDVRDARLELRALADSVKNAAWLTLLGDVFVTALEERFGEGALTFDDPAVTTTKTAHGLVVEAGALSLDDVKGGPFPIAVAEVDRRIAPLRLRGFANDELHSIGGRMFVATYTTYDGPFEDGSATRDWLERFTAPEGHLGPTPLERGKAHLRAIDAAAGTNTLAAWEARKKTRFSDLLQQINASAHGHETKDDVVEALAWAGRFPGYSQGVALVKLFYGLLLRGEAARATPYLALVPACAKRTKMLYHSAACVAARLGDTAAALAFAKEAKASGYEQLATMKSDADLKDLVGDPEFEALFS